MWWMNSEVGVVMLVLGKFNINGGELQLTNVGITQSHGS